jgi:hypothetical protein
MSEAQPASGRNTILIIAGVTALVLLCCCVIVAASAAFFLIVRSESSGGEIIITPETGSGPVTIVLLRDGAAIAENASPMDSYTDCYEATGIYRYRLEADNNNGFYQWMELQVIVEAGASP